MNTNTTGQKSIYTLSDRYDSQAVIVCQEHAKEMPQVNGDSVTSAPAEDDCECAFCRQNELQEMKDEYRARCSWLVACEERGGPRASMQAFDDCEREADRLRGEIARLEAK